MPTEACCKQWLNTGVEDCPTSVTSTSQIALCVNTQISHAATWIVAETSPVEAASRDILSVRVGKRAGKESCNLLPIFLIAYLQDFRILSIICRKFIITSLKKETTALPDSILFISHNGLIHLMSRNESYICNRVYRICRFRIFHTGGCSGIGPIDDRTRNSSSVIEKFVRKSRIEKNRISIHLDSLPPIYTSIFHLRVSNQSRDPCECRSGDVDRQSAHFQHNLQFWSVLVGVVEAIVDVDAS
jgi:hypothetical protein